MKNFALALVTFFIWALIGFWIHNIIRIQKTEPTELVMPNSKSVDSLQKAPKDSIFKIVAKKTFPKKILYLGFDKKSLTENKNIDDYINKLKKYTNLNTQFQIYIVGYTDDIGDEKDNYWIGLERANNFKKFLISKGINKKQIHTSSKGENEPTTKNNSLESRRKNRRIEITVKPN